jgi:hypothetical protein
MTGTALALIAGATRLIGPSTTVSLLLSLVVVDQVSFGRNFRTMAPAAHVFPSVPEIDRIKQDPGLFRTLGVGTHLFPNTALVYELQDVRSYDSLGVAHYADLLDVALSYVPAHQFHEADRLRALPLLDLLNVKYVIAPGATDVPPDAYAPVRGSSGGGGPVTAAGPTLYENLRVMPRAFLVDRTVVLEGNAARRTLRDARVNPRRTVVLDRPLPTEEQPAPVADVAAADAVSDPGAMGVARVTRYEDERVEIDTDAPASRVLVLTDTDFPGWRAFIDGRAAPIHRANFAFRAVAVPAGRHRVVFEYAPASVRNGAIVSGAALLAVVGLAATGGARPFRRRDEA